MDGLLFFTFILILIALYMKLRFPYLMGRHGEKFVSRKLNKLNATYYKVLNDLMLPSRGNVSTTQIDHIIVSNYGIFCVETKAYGGWIFGNADQEQWTQVFYQNKQRFYNPLRQNYAHTKAIEDLLGLRLKAPIVSLVAFPKAGKLKISGTDSVGCASDVVEKIKHYTNTIYSDTERDGIFESLARTNIVDKDVRKLHNKEVKTLKRG
jgi:hypothetical protein